MGDPLSVSVRWVINFLNDNEGHLYFCFVIHTEFANTLSSLSCGSVLKRHHPHDRSREFTQRGLT